MHQEDATLLEHTMAMAGDRVDAGATWQGWPVRTIIPGSPLLPPPLPGAEGGEGGEIRYERIVGGEERGGGVETRSSLAELERRSRLIGSGDDAAGENGCFPEGEEADEEEGHTVGAQSGEDAGGVTQGYTVDTRPAEDEGGTLLSPLLMADEAEQALPVSVSPAGAPTARANMSFVGWGKSFRSRV
jgi:hypothetical protein